MIRKRNLGVVIVAVLVVSTCLAKAGTISVGSGPGYDFNTIQPAINSAVAGDVVIVADGTYTGADNKNLDFGGKAISLKSKNGPENCIIDCENDGRGFYFHSGEDSNSILIGFTIQNGYVDPFHHIRFQGGGILCESSSPIINNCILKENQTDGGGGGGIAIISNSEAKILNCIFIQNIVKEGPHGYGAGMLISDSNVFVKNCLFFGNRGDEFYGSGVIGNYNATSVIVNCTFVGHYYGTSVRASNCNITLINCILWNDDEPWTIELFGNDHSHTTVINCDIRGGISGIVHMYDSTIIDGGGNINADPLFVSGLLGDYYLSQTTAGQISDSPCANAGNEPASSLGMDVFTTRTDNMIDSGIVDMGYHYPSVTLKSLAIVGPNQVTESSLRQYRAIAYYEEGFTRDVTAFSDWSVEPNSNCSIDSNGLLTTEKIDLPEYVTITAEYSEGENTQIAGKDVSIFAICPSGSALDFDGHDDYVRIEDDPALNPRNITLAAWIYPDDVSHNFKIINKSRFVSVVDYIFDNEGNNDALRLEASFGGGWDNLYSNDAVLTAGTWQHVAVTWDGSKGVFYVNGVNAGEDDSHSGDLSDSDSDVYIGYGLGYDPDRCGRCPRPPGRTPRPFDGMIDDVRIYNRALSADEIRGLLHTRPEAGEPNLVGYWDFDEGEGQVVADLSGNGNDGQLGDANTPDSSDPNWVDSNAPVGVCTPPVADAGQDQSVVIGEDVYLDGSGSSDADGDLLSFSWEFVSRPAGSVAEINSPTSEQVSFVPDIPGEYIVSLVVNDGDMDSEIDEVNITAISLEQAAMQALADGVDGLDGLDPNNFKNGNMKKALMNKMNALQGMIGREGFEGALQKLVNDIFPKMDGCAESGEPDKNDWIITCDGQDQVYPYVSNCIEYLKSIME